MMFLIRQVWLCRLGIAGLALVWALGPFPGGRALGQALKTTAASPDDSRARTLFGEVAQAYRALSSYSDQGQFVIAMTLGGKARKDVRPLRLTFVRPNKLDLDAGDVRISSDGKTLTTTVVPLKIYASAPAPEAITLETFREGQTGALLFGGASAAPMHVLLSLLTDANPDVLLDQLGGSIQPAPAAASSDSKHPGGLKTQGPAVLIDLLDGDDLVLSIDPTTKLLAAIELKIDPTRLAQSAPPGLSLSIERFGWTAGEISTQVAKDRSFAFEPPKDFAKVASLKDQPGAGQAHQYAIEDKVGKPGPDFTLTVLDGPDKTKTLTKAELAGKVVLIDFWATWCGPCLMELPEIQKLIESYAGSKKDVLIVALSQDSTPNELSEVRKLVEKTLSNKKINLAQRPVGLIGLDPSGSVGQAFDVEGFPTLVILDRKGVVQSAHVGYNPDTPEPLHKLLAKEIDALLEGKSLAAPKVGPEKKGEGKD
jgi:thiol-disulfide isomerase/thioredoxin